MRKYYEDNFTFMNSHVIESDFKPMDFDVLFTCIDDFDKKHQTRYRS
jgi:hypothetical protein